MQIADGAGHFFLFDPVHHPHQDLAGIDVFDEDPLAAGKGQDRLLAFLRVFTPAAATVGVCDLRRPVPQARPWGAR